MTKQLVKINDRLLTLSNLDKELFPGITKAHLLEYYVQNSGTILPFIENRPMVQKRYPDGIFEQYFYQKNTPAYSPEWLKTERIKTGSKYINYIIGGSNEGLIWIVNQASIELHCWLSNSSKPQCPNVVVFDLDPQGTTSFEQVKEIAILIKTALSKLDLKGYVKLSGSKGLHIFVPILQKYDFETVRTGVHRLCLIIESLHKDTVTTKTSKKSRGDKVYLDYLQNAYGKTMAWIFSVRPLPDGPISMPINWNDLNFIPSATHYNIKTIKKVSLPEDWNDFLTIKQSVNPLLELN